MEVTPIIATMKEFLLFVFVFFLRFEQYDFDLMHLYCPHQQKIRLQ